MLLPRAERERLLELARARYPREACGLLQGTLERDARGLCVRVLRVEETRNAVADAEARTRYAIDPLELLRCDEHARAAGLTLVGAWHTHPDHGALPSERDRAEAHEGWSYLIVAVDGRGAGALRAWRLLAGSFVEDVLEPQEEPR